MKSYYHCFAFCNQQILWNNISYVSASVTMENKHYRCFGGWWKYQRHNAYLYFEGIYPESAINYLRIMLVHKSGVLFFFFFKTLVMNFRWIYYCLVKSSTVNITVNISVFKTCPAQLSISLPFWWGFPVLARPLGWPVPWTFRYLLCFAVLALPFIHSLSRSLFYSLASIH